MIITTTKDPLIEGQLYDRWSISKNGRLIARVTRFHDTKTEKFPFTVQYPNLTGEVAAYFWTNYLDICKDDHVPTFHGGLREALAWVEGRL